MTINVVILNTSSPPNKALKVTPIGENGVRYEEESQVLKNRVSAQLVIYSGRTIVVEEIDV